MANSADLDEMPRFAASHLGLRYFVSAPFWDFFINALTTSPLLLTLMLGKLRTCIKDMGLLMRIRYLRHVRTANIQTSLRCSPSQSIDVDLGLSPHLIATQPCLLREQAFAKSTCICRKSNDLSPELQRSP